jgi:uncharacterized protein (TIGR01370 family)
MKPKLPNIMLSVVLAVFGLKADPAQAATRPLPKIESYAVYYSDKEPIEKFEPFDLLVLDSTHYPPLQQLREQGKVLLGYISLGEVEKRNHYYREMREANILLQENRNWPDSYYTDLRSSKWQKLVIEQLVPDILLKGFDGIFIDTLDSPLDLERRDPAKFSGMTQSTIRLIRKLRENFPGMIIMVNRGYEVLQDIAPYIDLHLGESVYADYNFAKKSYGRVKDSDYRRQVEWLQAAKQKNPNLQVMTLDYASPEDQRSLREIYRTQRKNGFVPYVATVKLDRIVPEPKP